MWFSKWGEGLGVTNRLWVFCRFKFHKWLSSWIFNREKMWFNSMAMKSPSSRGLGHRPFTAVTRVQIPLGTQGPVAQLVSAPPCHGGGRGFKSRLGREWQWLGSSVGTSVRLKIVRSTVRSRPQPLQNLTERRKISKDLSYSGGKRVPKVRSTNFNKRFSRRIH